MKALLVKKIGRIDDLVVEDHHLELEEDHRVLIEVHYAGVNFPDTLIVKGKYQFQPDLPFAPGGEVAGVVKEVGKSVTHVKPGDRVAAGTTWGGFAEEVLGWDFNTHLLPEGISFSDASSVLMTHGTAMHALKDRGQLRPGETLAVLGASGGVGTAAIQLGKWMGARVIACASSSEKLAFCQGLGADECVNYSEEPLKDRLKALTGGNGVDVVFDAVGGAYSEPAFRAIAAGGRHLVVGFASGSVPAIPWNLPLLKSASITGVFWGGFFRKFPDDNKKNIAELFDLVKDRKVVPQVDTTYSLYEGKKALKRIGDRDVKGKVLIKLR